MLLEFLEPTLQTFLYLEDVQILPEHENSNHEPMELKKRNQLDDVGVSGARTLEKKPYLFSNKDVSLKSRT
jgi:hypothetical protein